MTTVIQDALFGDDTPPAPRPKPTRRVKKLDRRKHQRPPRRDREWNELTDCAPVCLACGTPEPPDDADAWPLCPVTLSRCATVCAHTTEPYKADICLITTHVTAELMTLPNSGRTIAAVTCPHCAQLHAHDPTPGHHYRTSRCPTGRKPYIIHVPDRSTP
ncbi:hypothetical protein [Nonomuraea sp. 10N515B]|uniref:hypothetical protein n=1 Tax=Nonomuraea sp. 10N515B TaxID=3457422 RepID=UPI003FCC474C